jgi:integrase
MKSLEWRDVDLRTGIIRLRSAVSKNGRPRELPLAGELRAILDHAHERRRPECRAVFHQDGKPIGAFRKTWASACKAAGLGKVLIHDLRRSAARNFVRAGTPEKIAMSISGHKTRSVFDRYNIVSGDDQVNAIRAQEAYLAKLAESAPAPTVTALERREKAA